METCTFFTCACCSFRGTVGCKSRKMCWHKFSEAVFVVTVAVLVVVVSEAVVSLFSQTKNKNVCVCVCVLACQIMGEGSTINCSHCQRPVFLKHVLSSIFVIAVINHFSWFGKFRCRSIQLVLQPCN